jgi:hypothetical protein
MNTDNIGEFRQVGRQSLADKQGGGMGMPPYKV